MAAVHGQDWDIKACGGSCRSTEQAFADGETYISRIMHCPEGYLREDYSLDAWTKELQQESISYWKSVHRIVPKEEKVDVFGPESAEKMLRGILENGDESQRNTMYVLALMLERKRILIERTVQVNPDGAKIRCYEHKKSGDAFMIPDPGLRLDEMQEIQIQVARDLGWTPPGESVEAEAPEAQSEGEVESPVPEAPAEADAAPADGEEE